MRTGGRESPRFSNEQNCRDKRRISSRGANRTPKKWAMRANAERAFT